MTLPADITQVFFETLDGDKTELEFEQWLYAEKRLEKLLPQDDYLELISYGYKSEESKDGWYKMLEKWIEKGDFEKWRLYKLLRKALQRGDDLSDVLKTFYNLYCNGYSFLHNLGLAYGLTIEVPYPYANFWDELTKEEQQSLLDGFYPQLEIEINKVIGWLADSKVILTGRQNEYGRYEYIDNRTPSEKIPTAYLKV